MSRSQNKRSLCCISRQTLGNNKFVARLHIRYVLTNVTISKTGPTGEARVGVGVVRAAAGIVLPVTATSHNPNPQLKCKRPKDSTHGSCLTPPRGHDCCLCSFRNNPTFHHNVPHFNSHRIDARVCTYSHLRSTIKFCNCRINWPLGTWQPCAQACQNMPQDT